MQLFAVFGPVLFRTDIIEILRQQNKACALLCQCINKTFGNGKIVRFVFAGVHLHHSNFHSLSRHVYNNCAKQWYISPSRLSSLGIYPVNSFLMIIVS